MLPNQGNGAFTLHANAFDLDGRLRGARVARHHGAERDGDRAVRRHRYARTGRNDRRQLRELRLGPVARASRGPSGRRLRHGLRRRRGRRQPGGWNQRADLTASFPGYPGIDTALGVFGLNTLAFANGLHTIAWVVTDNGGVTAGVGSRFFSIFNTGAVADRSGDAPGRTRSWTTAERRRRASRASRADPDAHRASP